jgi:hypothetical protein
MSRTGWQLLPSSLIAKAYKITPVNDEWVFNWRSRRSNRLFANFDRAVDGSEYLFCDIPPDELDNRRA